MAACARTRSASTRRGSRGRWTTPAPTATTSTSASTGRARGCRAASGSTDGAPALVGSRAVQNFERSSYPPIAEYAFISDCEVGALIAPSGNVEWLCLPQFDSPSVLCPILDRDVGRFRVGPADGQGPAARRYLPGSMGLGTTWETPSGWGGVPDAICNGPWHHH